MLTPLGFNRFRLANTEFISSMAAEDSTASCFYVNKPAKVLDSYHVMRRKLRFGRILQLTGQDSGGAALTCLVAAPSKLVSVSTSETPPSALVEFARMRGIEQSLRVYHGVAQDDRARLTDIAEEEFGERGIDVVLDDVSNQLDVALAAFESLFPHLRAGGLYIIEGWALAHKFMAAFLAKGELTDADSEFMTNRYRNDPRRPVDAILPELLAATRARPELIDQLTVDEFWIEIRRGPEHIDPATFRLDVLVTG